MSPRLPLRLTCLSGNQAETNCDECSPGKYMDEAGKQECKDCDVSETSKAGATICTKCDAGLFLSTSSLSTSDSKICRRREELDTR